MDLIQAVILGIVEGITEFLPISSTGHLILVADLLNITQTEFVKTFEIAIQSGAILAVIILYWKKLTTDMELNKRILTGFIPTAIIGFILYDSIKEYLIGNVYVVLIALLTGGIAIILIELILRRTSSHLGEKTFKMPTYKQSIGIGLFQALAVIPGVSRSASSILGGMILGTSRETAVEFSFLLAIPTILAATALDLSKTSYSFTQSEWIWLSVGFITSFISAYFAIKWFIKFVKTNTLIPFGIYRIALAIIYLLLIVK